MSRYGETAINSWVRMQRSTWDCNAGTAATRIVLEDANGSQIWQWPADLKDLEDVIQDAVTMHAGELPVGNHSFRLVAYGEGKTQLGELPQTLRGRSKEATSAASDMMAMAKSMAVMLNNTQQMYTLQAQQFELQEKRLGDQYENVALLIDRNLEIQSQNLEVQLQLEKFHKEEERRDQRQEAVLSILTPLATLAAQKYGPKLLNMSPAEIGTKVSDLFKGSDKPPAEPKPESTAESSPEPKAEPEPVAVTITKADLEGFGAILRNLATRLAALEQTSASAGKEGPPDEDTTGTPVEPVCVASPDVSESGQATVQRDRQAGRQRSAQHDLARPGQQSHGGTRTKPTNHQKAKRVSP